ncbi:2-dehydropantoate 2-reductase [bacterium]|nr:2-dehydropantoate 2-reductase [bacterium]MCB2201519.1 2-dehydropantoate 2-reductase [bacterium]
MKIYIIGAGAIGKALAVFLQEDGKDVTIIRGSVDNEPEQQHAFTVIDPDGHRFQQDLTTTTFSNIDRIDGIVLVTAKAFANEFLAKKLKDLEGSFSIVLLQNGLNIEHPFDSFDRVYRCVLFATSQFTDDATATFKSMPSSPIGSLRGKNEHLDEIVDHITTPHFGFRSEPNILKHIWDKLIINCAFNSICPLLEVDNGIFQRNEEVMRLARIVISECVALAGKLDIALDRAEIEDILLLISTHSEGKLISTYQDILKGRRTEIDSLNLEIARLADEKGVPELVATTRLLGEMTRLKSEIHE